MAIPELSYRWTLTSSGAGAALDNIGLQHAERITFIAQCEAAADTVAFGIEHAMSSTGKFQRMGSTAYSVSSGGSVTVQLTGPLFVVRPFVIAVTASTSIVTVAVMGN